MTNPVAWLIEREWEILITKSKETPTALCVVVRRLNEHITMLVSKREIEMSDGGLLMRALCQVAYSIEAADNEAKKNEHTTVKIL